MLDISILAVGKLKEKSYQAIFSEYEKRLAPFARVKVVELNAASFGARDQARAIAADEALISNYLEKNRLSASPAKVYLLSEKGVLSDSKEFAAKIDDGPLILVLGGALGFSSSFAARYEKISLSPLTMPHELARVVLIEQLYRAAAILRGKEYDY
jgi:23S rRNA (pseudouridine1915-N3)-methyltransferase